jgi:predicted PurR-regulated permease PerM
MLAFYITVLMLPGYRWLLERNLPPWLAVVTTLVVAVGCGLLLVGLAWLAANRLAAGLGQHAERVGGVVANVQTWLDQTGAADSLSQGLSGIRLETLIVWGARALRFVADGLVAISTGLVLVSFFLLEAGRFERLVRTELSWHSYLGVFPEVADAAVRYFIVRLRVNLLTGLAMGVAFLLFGVEYAALWTVLVVVLSYVPYVGLVVAMLPPVLLVLAEHGIVAALALIVVSVVVNAVAENILAPSLSAKSLSLSPTVVFLSFLFWSWLLGFAGMLLAMPLTVMLMLVLDRDPATQWLAQLIGSQRITAPPSPSPSPPSQEISPAG